MALSTTIPNTTMSAAKVTIFSSMPAIYIMDTETKVVNGMVMAATMAERKGNNTIITRMMINMEMSRSRRKSLTLIATTFGLSAIRVTFTSSGSSFKRNSSRTLSTSCPYCTTLLPGVISIDSSTQGWPSCSIRLDIGSYSLTTRATSLTRATLPLTGSLKIIWLAISSSDFSWASTWMGTCWSSSLMLPAIVVMPWAWRREKSICWPIP